MKKLERVNMGIGQLGSSEIIFVRKFRFQLEGDHFEPWSVQKVSVDLTNKQLNFECYEVVDMNGNDSPVEMWLQGMLNDHWPNETLRLTTLDGCGMPLYEYIFENLKVRNRYTLDFDMATSNEVTQKVLVEFKNYKRNFLIPKKHNSKLILGDKEIDVVLKKRPTLNIEETEINYLNSQLYLPGQNHWEDLVLTVKNEDQVPYLLSQCKNSMKGVLVLKKESWEIGQMCIKSHNAAKRQGTEITFSIKDVKYSPKTLN